MPQEYPKKERAAIWFTPETLRRCDAAVILANCRSRSEFAEKAVNHYAGWLSAQHHTNYFAEAVSQMVSGVVASTENRLARLQFKTAVELAKLAHMTAAAGGIDEDTLRRLHIRCVDEVKKINGVVKFEDAVAFQHG